METKIKVDTKTFIRFWLVPFGICLAGFIIWSARTGLLILGASLFLALALNPIVSKMANILPGHGKMRKLATALAYIIVVSVLGAIIAIVVPTIIDQTIRFARELPAMVESATSGWNNILAGADSYGLGNIANTISNSVTQFFGGFSGSGMQFDLWGSAGSFISSVGMIILVLVLAFLILVDGPAMMRKTWELFKGSARANKIRLMLEKMAAVVSNYVGGQLLVSLIDGAVTSLIVFVLCLIFGLDAGLALPFGLITGVMSLIPMFGAVIGGAIVAILLAFNSVPAGIIYAIFFVVYQQVENNVIAPAVQSRSSKLPALAILGSVTIGIYMFGLLGGIIAIPIAGCIQVLIKELGAVERLSKRNTAPKTE